MYVLCLYLAAKTAISTADTETKQAQMRYHMLTYNLMFTVLLLLFFFSTIIVLCMFFGSLVIILHGKH